MANLQPRSSEAVQVQFPSENITIAGGVAIFHIASQRVVVCRHSVHGYWFLPKGRRDAGEESGKGAEREGYEESGYRNRLLPLSIKHRQPQAHPRTSAQPPTAEPIWVQLQPLSRTRQYLLFWYIAETLPPNIEDEINARPSHQYQAPPAYPPDLKLCDRVLMEPKNYEPMHHKNTGVDDDELLFESYLLPIDEALERLQRSQVMADVVRRGWKGICERWAAEEEEAMRSE